MVADRLVHFHQFPNQKVADLVISNKEETIKTLPLYADEDLKKDEAPIAKDDDVEMSEPKETTSTAGSKRKESPVAEDDAKIDGNNIETDFEDEDEEKFVQLGKFIDEKIFFLKITGNNLYKYKLELRENGLMVMPLNKISRTFLDKAKQAVIEASIYEASQMVGFVEDKIKTIMINFD